ncbi:MAG: hypothetical protein KBF88_17385, partial [Polyangiaceae bacterium]|nr:hypothetical protein [Polyangiaceae bacterium]
MSEQTCGGTFEVRFQRSELRQIQSRAIRALVRNQIDLGVVRQVSPVEEILQFSVEKWRDAGRAPEDESDEELVD